MIRNKLLSSLALIAVVGAVSHGSAQSRSELPSIARCLASSTPTPGHSTLPKTDRCVIPFSDQIPSGLPDVFLRFAATHFAGAQKMLKDDNDRVRSYNRNWVLLHYQLGMGASPAEYIRGMPAGRSLDARWSASWPFVSSHESWFMHNQNGARHCGAKNYNCILNVSDPDVQKWWIDEAISAMRAAGAQGVFADTFLEGISSYDVTPPDVRFAGINPGNPSVWPGGVTWLQQRVNWANTIAHRFQQTPERFLLIPNIASQATGWDSTDFSATAIDGAMLEGVALDTQSTGDWQLEMNRALPLTSKGKIVLFQTYPKGTRGTAAFEREVDFALASYLLVKGDYTYINLPGGQSGVGTSMFYYPQYDAMQALGSAVDPLPTDVSAYLSSGIYRRKFQNGLVLVNPAASAATVDLGGTYQQQHCSGGGEVSMKDIDQRTVVYRGGECRSTAATALTVGPWSGAVLFHPGVSIQ